MNDANRAELVMGIDIGTTSTKAVVFDRQGRVLARHGVEYPLYTPEPAAAEQDPDEILLALIKAVHGAVAAAGVRPGAIQGVGLSCAMHSLLLVDGQGKPLTPSFTWAVDILLPPKGEDSYATSERSD